MYITVQKSTFRLLQYLDAIAAVCLGADRMNGICLNLSRHLREYLANSPFTFENTIPTRREG